MNPATLMHGSDWSGENLAGWLAAEKLDGWRAFWDGRQLWTRQGKRYAAPAAFLAGLPNFHLDCELVAAESTSDRKVCSLVKSGRWDSLRLRPFLAPGGQDISRLPGAVEWFPVRDTLAAIAAMRLIQEAGGEGLMLRKPGSRYTAGRTGNLLKLKNFLPQ